MIRVLIVEASSGGVLGGSLTGLYHMIRGLDRARFEPAVVLYQRQAIEADLARLGVPVHYVTRPRLPKEHVLLDRPGYLAAKRIGAVRAGLRAGRLTARLAVEELPAAMALARIIRRVRTDVVHLGNGPRANFDGILAALLTRRPVVCHVKGFEKYGARERWAARRVTTLVCMTEAVLAHCRAHRVRAPEERVVYDAVDKVWLTPRRAPSEVRGEIGVPEGVPCIGIAGNIQEWKGQRVVVEALILIADRTGAHLVVAGGVHRAGAAYDAALRARVAELGLAARVHFTGFREDIVDVMNACDVVVHASVRPEPFGRVILEGMLLGKPVVATSAGGVLELIEDGRTGFLVAPGEVAALAARIDLLLAEPAMAAAVGARAREWAGERFSLSRHVEQMSCVYDRAHQSYRRRAHGVAGRA